MARKVGRPRKPESEKIARAGKQLHMFVRADIWERVETYMDSQAYRPKARDVVEHALDELLKKSGF